MPRFESDGALAIESEWFSNRLAEPEVLDGPGLSPDQVRQTWNQSSAPFNLKATLAGPGLVTSLPNRTESDSETEPASAVTVSGGHGRSLS